MGQHRQFSTPFKAGRRPGALLALGLLLAAGPSALRAIGAEAAPHPARATDLRSALRAVHRPAAHRPASPRADAILGAALGILADGTEPWEDRPLQVFGLGTLPGSRGKVDPGDDLGPADRVVRSWDAVIYRASFSVREATAQDLVAEVTLSELAVWESGQLAALRLAGCPGGASLSADGRTLRCLVGEVKAPPAVTVALDLSARVSGAALQGDVVTAGLTVSGRGLVPDQDPAGCALPRAGGCDAAAPPVTVSASPAAELRKVLTAVSPQAFNGVPGRLLGWRLDAVLGADGDARGSSLPVGEPWTLPDWWRLTGRGARPVDLPVTLVSCVDPSGRADWTCAQPGGPGTELAVTIHRIDALANLPNGIASAAPQVVGQLLLQLWVPEAQLQATGGDVTFQNCFATEVGVPGRSIWRPVDARGQPNLGGAAEPPANNCSYAVLAVPTVAPTARPPRPAPPPRPGPPGRPAPVPTPLPAVVGLGKRYTPYTQGAGVTDGTEFAAEVRAQIGGGGALGGLILCDKWDNSSHLLRDGGVAGVRLWQQPDGGAVEPWPDDRRVVVEYAVGRWGRQRTAQISVGRAWYLQATARCDDAAPGGGPGWVTAGQVDFGNQGGGRIDAREVNMVRVRYLDAVPVGRSVLLELLFKAEQNPPGTWLMNYGAVGWGSGRGASWRADPCYGPVGSRSRSECPVPAPGTRTIPGNLGDMLVHVGVPLWLQKRTDPVVPDGAPVVNAGAPVRFVLEAASFPRPADPPLPPFPPGAYAPGVRLTDTLPPGLIYELGSSTVDSEDLNESGGLDPGEDLNGNGRLDRNVSFEPGIQAGAAEGETTLTWVIGNLPYQRRVPLIRYAVRTSRLLRGGSSLANMAALWAANDRPPDCRPGPRDAEGGRCAWAQVIVANIAAAQVEKLPRLPLVLPGQPMVYRLALANLTARPVEWFDAVDILPRAGEPREPQTRVAGGFSDVQAQPVAGGAPIEVWASATDPELLDGLGGSPRDGLLDPVAAYGAPGAGLGGGDWPCRLGDVGGGRCAAIPSRARVTALRLWGPDPKPSRTGGTADSFLPAGAAPRFVDVTLAAPGSMVGDLAHNAWGGRFESLPLPVFDGAVIRVRPPDTPTPTTTPVPSDTPVPTATSSPTITPSPTATASPTATLTPTITPSPTLTSTATPTPIYTIYLPMVLRIPCQERAVDVALVVDVSSSMRRPAGDGGTKLDAVLRAARAFVEQFQPTEARGRVAVVAFNNEAWLLQPLTSDRALLDAALAGLPRRMAEGTRLDLGLSAGAAALAAVPAPRLRAMVFLTDGLPNRVPTPMAGGTQEDTVLVAAAAARAAGIRIQTVGYGREDALELVDRILPWLLRAIAGDTGGYSETDDAGVLAEVFRSLAAKLGCVKEVQWP